MQVPYCLPWRVTCDDCFIRVFVTRFAKRGISHSHPTLMIDNFGFVSWNFVRRKHQHRLIAGENFCFDNQVMVFQVYRIKCVWKTLLANFTDYSIRVSQSGEGRAAHLPKIHHCSRLMYFWNFCICQQINSNMLLSADNFSRVFLTSPLLFPQPLEHLCYEKSTKWILANTATYFWYTVYSSRILNG